MGAFGGSYLNHQWLVCACTPVFKNPPESMYARLDKDGKLLKKPDSPSARDGAVQTYSGGIGGQVTPDGFSVNTTQPPYQPSGVPPAADGSPDLADPKGDARIGTPLPPQTIKTIGDTLSAKNVSWAWYSGGWNAAADGVTGRRAARRHLHEPTVRSISAASPLPLLPAFCARYTKPSATSQGW
jgi:phospholipase C